MRITTIHGMVSITGTEREWMDHFHYKDELALAKDNFISVRGMLVAQWDLPVCPTCGEACPLGYICGDCRGGDDRDAGEPATFVDPDSGRRHSW